MKARSTDAQLAELVEQANQTGLRSPLLNAMLGLSQDLKSNRRMVWTTRAIMLLVALLAVIFWQVHSNAIDRIERNRAEARVASCQQDNRNRSAVRQTIYESAVQAVAPTPEQLGDPRVQAFLARYSATIDAQLPDRDCTPAGITAYLTPQPGG